MSNENVICLCGKLVEVLFEEDTLGETLPMGDDGFDKLTRTAQHVMNGKRLKEVERVILDPSIGNFGCVVPAGVWHTVEVLEPSVIYEAKDGAYGMDGSETYDPMKKLKEQITYLIGMERQSGSMDNPSPLYISRMLNVPLKEVEKAMDSILPFE